MPKTKYTYYEVEPAESIAHILDLALESCPGKIAYKYKEHGAIRAMTYDSFLARVFALGAFLHARQLTDCNIACIGANSIRWILTYFTVLRGSGAFVPLDKELPPKDILYLLQNSEAKVVFYDAKYEALFRENRAALSGVKLFIGFDRKENDGDFISFADALTGGETLDKSGYLSCTTDPNAMKLLVYTSGTTGMSKGVMLTEHNLVSSVYYGLQVSTVFETGLSVLPYHHTYESVSDLLVSFHHHSTLCINESFTSILKNMKLYQPEYVYVVPALAEMFYTRIMRDLNAKNMTESFEKLVTKSNNLRRIGMDKRRELFAFLHDIFGGNLRKIVCGGAPIRAEVAAFFDNIGISLVNGYGITECSPLVSANPDTANDYQTCGIRLPCVEWKIDEPNAEGIGEVLIKGDIVMLGYYKDPERTAEVLRDGWFYTGDYGRINEKDQLIIAGRKKNIIVLNNGKNIYPEEIEGYIQGIDYVSEVVVSGDTDDKGNESSLLAEVYLTEKKTPSEVLRSIRSACRELPIYKQISRVVIRDREFEKTSTNKIKRFMKNRPKNKDEK